MKAEICFEKSAGGGERGYAGRSIPSEVRGMKSRARSARAGALLVVAALWAGFGSFANAADTPIKILQSALLEEEANHNLPAAVEIYESLLVRLDEQREVSATAIYRLAECYRKMGQAEAARALYRRVMREFPDQSPFFELSRAYLRSTNAPLVDFSQIGGHVPDFSADGRVYHPATEDEAVELKRLAGLAKDSPDRLNAAGPKADAPPSQTAARLGQIAVTEYLLAHGVGVDDAGFKGAALESPLALAAFHGHKTVVETLLAHKANVNVTTFSGKETPLYLASLSGYKNVMEVLIAHGADVNAKTPAGDTPLHAAVGSEAATELLLAKGARTDARNNRGQTPLMIAVGKRRVEVVQALLRSHADPNVADNLGLVALRYAAYDADKELCEMLLAAGAMIDARNGAGRTLAHGLAERGDEELLEFFLGRGADVNARDKAGRTPIRFVLSENFSGTDRLKVAGVLSKRRADLKIRDINDGAVLHDLARLPKDESTAELAALLLDNGAEVDAVDKNGNTPLWFAILKPNLLLINILLAHHADPNLPDAKGRTLLHRLSYVEFSGWGHDGPAGVDRLLQLLLNNGAMVSAKDRDGRTPLHFALADGRYTLARILLDNGADANAKDNAGRTPMDLAGQVAGENGYALKALLIAHGATDPVTGQARVVGSAGTPTGLEAPSRSVGEPPGRPMRLVSVGGEVRLPSRCVWLQGLTVAKAVQTAGGLTDRGDEGRVVLRRANDGPEKGKEIVVDLRRAAREPAADMLVFPGDSILVQRTSR